jgi:hypothetical protein
MSKKHPLDDTFRRKLRSYEGHAPDRLWQQIDAKRSWRQKAQNKFRYYKGGLAVAATLVLALGAWWIMPTSPAVELGHFQIEPQLETSETPHLPIAVIPTQRQTPIIPLTIDNPTTSNTNSILAAEKTTTLNDYFPANQPAETAIASTNQEAPKVTDNELTPASRMTEVLAQKGNLADQAFRPSFAAMSALPSMAAAPWEPGFFKTELKCESFKTGKRHWYGELSTGTTTSLRDLQAREGEDIPYAEGRAETESAAFSHNTELRLSIVSPSGFAFRTGLNYTQLNDQFDYYNPNETKMTITNYYGPNGEIISQDTIIEIGTREKTTRNRFRMIDVPLIMGYELKYDKVTFAFNAGMYLNLSYTQKGDFLPPSDQEPVSFSSDAIDAYPAYKSQIGLGWYGSIGMYYQMNARTHVYLEPSLRMYTQSSTIDEYPLKHNYALGSLNIGLRRVIF